MLCDICLKLVSNLVQLQREGRTSGSIVVREIVRPGTHQSGEERENGCSLCTAVSKKSGPLVKDSVAHFEVYGALEKQNLNFVFSNALDHKFYIEHTDQQACELAMRCQLSSSNGSKAFVDLAAHWFRNCLYHHERCNARHKSIWYPRRLLDVSGTTVRLIQTARDTPDGPYATLSHCWGQHKFLVLTEENMEQFVEGLPLESFLPSFRDAIAVLRHLGLRYIWIDCFCIIQESDSGNHVTEKSLDIAQMREVYASSILNIGASHANNPTVGCFASCENALRGFRRCSEYFFPTTSEGEEGVENFHLFEFWLSKDNAQTLHLYKLFQRAWILQERLLCPRMLHFGNGDLYWECQEVPIASETLPCGSSTVESDESTIFSVPVGDMENWDLDSWIRIVEDYSGMELSKPMEDKFVAIGGIAQAIVEAAQVEYFVGYLGRDLLLQLCWRILTSSTRPPVWRAPSWSWASVDGYVAFDQSMTFSQNMDLARVEELSVELADPGNRYGAVKSGSLVLIGRPIETSLIPGQETVGSFSMWEFSIPSGAEHPILVKVDDPPKWPKWDTAGFPGMNEDDTVELHSLYPCLYAVPLVVSLPSNQGIMTIEEALANPALMTSSNRDVLVAGLLVQKLSSDTYVRRGTIRSGGYRGQNRHRQLLQQWVAREDEKITIF